MNNKMLLLFFPLTGIFSPKHLLVFCVYVCVYGLYFLSHFETFNILNHKILIQSGFFNVLHS